MDPAPELRPFRGRPDARGWAVIGTDGQKIGEVRELLEEADGKTRYFEIELDQTLLEQSPALAAGQYPADPSRPGARPLADADPTAGEAERTAFYNPGARQHAPQSTAAVPHADDRQGGSGRLTNPRVRIPWEEARLKERDAQVVLERLRGSDLMDLPVLAR
jgi:hypothetical protein